MVTRRLEINATVMVAFLRRALHNLAFLGLGQICEKCLIHKSGFALTGVWIIIARWSLMVLTMSNGYTDWLRSIRHIAVSMVMRTPVRPIPALRGGERGGVNGPVKNCLQELASKHLSTNNTTFAKGHYPSPCSPNVLCSISSHSELNVSRRWKLILWLNLFVINVHAVLFCWKKKRHPAVRLVWKNQIQSRRD